MVAVKVTGAPYTEGLGVAANETETGDCAPSNRGNRIANKVGNTRQKVCMISPCWMAT